MEKVIPEITLRSATNQDYAFLYRLHVSALKESIEEIWSWDEGWQRQHFRDHFSIANQKIIPLGYRDIGSLVVHRLDTHIFLEYIAILPEFQNRGIGTELIREVLEEAAAKGFPVELKVLKINPAIRLYERLGFEVESRTETRFFMAAEPIERST